MQNRPEYLFAWAGLAKLGVVVPLINPHLRGETLRHVLEAADARWLIVGAECLENLATVSGERRSQDLRLGGAGVVLPLRTGTQRTDNRCQPAPRREQLVEVSV